MVSLSAEIPEWNLRWPYAPAVRARNSVSYLTARRFSAQDRVNAEVFGMALKRSVHAAGSAFNSAMVNVPSETGCSAQRRAAA
jgi:hypothetical protein